MTDLTAITTPFGLLDRETQEALKAHGGPHQVWDPTYVHQWFIIDEPSWVERLVYRVKPAPPKPREWWFCIHDCSGFASTIPTHVEGSAERSRQPGQSVIHVREVLPECPRRIGKQEGGE